METAEDLRRFGERLRKFRLQAGLSQARLAALAETKATYISDLEHGRTPPSMKMAIRLADALGVSVDALVGRADCHQQAKPRRRFTEEEIQEIRDLVWQIVEQVRERDGN